MIVEDNVVGFPRRPTCGRPVGADRLLQPGRGEGPGGAADLLRATRRRPRRAGTRSAPSTSAATRPCWQDFSDFCASAARRRCRSCEFIHESPVAQPLPLPGGGRLPRASRPLGADLAPPRLVRARHRRRPGSCRTSCRRATAELVYLSLGSPRLRRRRADARLIDELADTPAPRASSRKGPQHDAVRAGRQHGRRGVPAPDLDPPAGRPGVTHGGNNTVTECLHFGKPMVVLPLFWDQYDNAQRVRRARLRRAPRHLRARARRAAGAIDTLLGDEMLRERLGRVSARLQKAPGTETAASLIERVAAKGS